ncbi:MAG: M6 family metalloprotease domain-containing protein [Methanotrichaceae archaeon]|nr:M6 family metalloprotease domain-containing protein [Methanotrichaceae archaeon]
MSAILGESLLFPQRNGPQIRLTVFGDEFYSYLEDDDGFSVIYDTEIGLYTYARLLGGMLISTGVPLPQGPPAGVKRHLRESQEVIASKFEERYARNYASRDGVARVFGRNMGLLEGRRVDQGKVVGLTILVQFSDIKTSITPADVSEMLNTPGYKGNGNFCSVRDYFLKMSNGMLDYSNVVIGPITLSHEKQYYVEHPLVEETLQAAARTGINLKQFDSKRLGYIDAINILYAGKSLYQGDYIWPHNGIINIMLGDMRAYFYMLTGLGDDKTELSIGTFCHENGHMLCRLPDLYDYGKRDGDFQNSAGFGSYCLMSYGNHLNNGKTPAPICAYLRNLVCWCNNKVSLNEAGEYQARHGDYGTVLIYQTGEENEYFIVENRSALDLDENLPSSGLAVYHCDIFGSNEWQGGTPQQHYQCGLLQADGHLDLERNRNEGDSGDLFDRIDGLALSHDTVPSSCLWDRSESGLTISNISEPGPVISFRTGPVKSAKVARGEAVPAAMIKDNDPQGASSVITLSEKGKICALRVSLDITHTYIGDLKAELIAPSGQRAVLHNREGGSKDNLILTYDSESKKELKAFLGLPSQGDWTLWVADQARIDTGKLNRWSIELELEATAGSASYDAAPDMDIPDNDPTGIGHAIMVDREGVVQSVKVSVDIGHNYVSDLRVELFSPGGKRAVLHNATGSGKPNIVKTFEAKDVADLAGFKGQLLKGNWILRVTDLEQRDVGKLNRWGIEFTFLE